MNKPPNKLDTNSGNEDFTSSMARLAELAAKNIESDEKKREKTRAGKDDEFREFMTAKRKSPQDTSWSARFFGRSHKIRLNPYVASGFLIILISAGFICAPRISKYFEEQAAELERKKAAASQVTSQTDASLKNYTVFDVAKDVSNGEIALKTKSISDLAQEVAEANEKFGSKLDVSWNFTNFNIAPESKNDSTINNEEISGEIENTEVTSLSTEDTYIPEDWAHIDLVFITNEEFVFEDQCVDPNLFFEESVNETIFRDMLLKIGAIGGNQIDTKTCS